MIETITRDPEVQEKFDFMVSRQAELGEQLAAATNEQGQILVNLGAFVVEGCDWKEYTDRLAELRAEIEALDAGLLYLAGQKELSIRLNHWLTR